MTKQKAYNIIQLLRDTYFEIRMVLMQYKNGQYGKLCNCLDMLESIKNEVVEISKLNPEDIEL